MRRYEKKDQAVVQTLGCFCHFEVIIRIKDQIITVQFINKSVL